MDFPILISRSIFRVFGLGTLLLLFSFIMEVNASETKCGEEPSWDALYDRGVPGPEITKLWFSHVRCRAEEGDAVAQLNVGLVYRDGSAGPPRNDEDAANWFRKSADQNNPVAQANLAWFYELGRGVEQDLIKAYMWYSLAASHVDWRWNVRSWAEKGLERVASQMTSQQISQAQGVAKDFWERHQGERRID